MKQILLLIMTLLVIASCGNEDETALRQEQARRDSLEAVQAARNSQAGREAAAAAESSDSFDLSSVTYTTTGTFTVQVGAWRSEEKANQLAEVWKNRGFSQAYVERVGTPETGDVWFRVRLGRTASRTQADGMSAHVNSRYGVSSWVADYK